MRDRGIHVWEQKMPHTIRVDQRRRLACWPSSQNPLYNAVHCILDLS